ncbi:hypothetical protein [Lamprobacter modestohalophilus]|nr:hypothetical protein [Lamprobacter modestohalophilus]
MDPLAKPLRPQLEDAIVKARDLAEQAAQAAQAALQHLGVGDADAPPHLTDSERALRRRLRAHGRELGVLRAKPNIKWTKDRGKDVESAPWFPVFNSERINDHHLTLVEKRAARAQLAEGAVR